MYVQKERENNAQNNVEMMFLQLLSKDIVSIHENRPLAIWKYILYLYIIKGTMSH